MPTLAEIPDVGSIVDEHPAGDNPLGLKGGGEGGINGVPAAVANAAVDALAAEGLVRRLPLTANAVREILRSRAAPA
jgi:carbon-monoxide dehydrogenase large subunit/6-hydroxypseudooxynicotine dehydrogenase subunit gamma